jgi:hypothetical protein
VTKRPSAAKRKSGTANASISTQRKLRFHQAHGKKVTLNVVGTERRIEGDRLSWRLLSVNRAVVLTPLHCEDGSPATFIPTFNFVEIAPVNRDRTIDVAPALNSLLLSGEPTKTAGAAVHNLAYRADFKAGKASTRVYLSDCQVDMLDGEDRRLLSVKTPSPERRCIQKPQHKVFNAEVTRATLPGGKRGPIALEPEQTKLVKRILAEEGHCIERRKLVKERVAGAQPEKYFKRGALKELWDAGVIGSTISGRLRMYRVKPFLD